MVGTSNLHRFQRVMALRRPTRELRRRKRSRRRRERSDNPKGKSFWELRKLDFRKIQPPKCHNNKDKIRMMIITIIMIMIIAPKKTGEQSCPSAMCLPWDLHPPSPPSSAPCHDLPMVAARRVAQPARDFREKKTGSGGAAISGIEMGILYSYVKLPEGTIHITPL